ncbi:MAG: helix-turn-helix transcriptional regulator [Alphaproteobacteria bacterium]|jgi:transcriptional regulator with XRE-family HTH domain|nr:helix-turn-helix transcriptional regulator [Alphaproteobacteria bacterium]
MVTRVVHSIDSAVGARIRERRTAIGMGLETLGAKIGLSGQTIRKLEYGSDQLPPSRLVALARALGIGVSFFFDPADWQAATDDRQVDERALDRLNAAE